MEDLYEYMNPKVVTIIKGAIRKSFVLHCEAYQQALSNAVSPSELGPRGGKRFICASCGGTFAQNKVEVDHIHPVIQESTTAKRMTLETYYKNIWTDVSNLQVLCISCHDNKTKAEVLRRKAHRAELKNVNINKKVKK